MLENFIDKTNEISKNYKKVLNRLQYKMLLKPLNVVFLNSELSKWAYQSLYEELDKNPNFNVQVLLTVRKSYLKKKYEFLNYKQLLKDSYSYFKNLNMNVQYAFDIEQNKYISLDKFEPDIIFYEQAGDVDSSQNIYVTSKYAISCYCSYGSSTTNGKNEYALDFLNQVYKYYLDNDYTKNFLINKGFKKEQLVVSGSIKFDAYRKEIDLSNQIWKTNDKKRIIWAPHHSFYSHSTLNFGTFDWNYKFFLEYIKKHQEYEFVIKPHPDLKRQIVRNNLMTKTEMANYFDELNNLSNAQVYEGTGYIDLFRCSDIMITDCNSFLSEYLLTKKPVIHLINKTSVGFNEYGQKIISGYYSAETIEDIESNIYKILIKNEDYLKETRLNIIHNDIVYNENSVANLITKDLIETIRKRG